MTDKDSLSPVPDVSTSDLLANARDGSRDAWFALDARIDRAVRSTLGPRVGGVQDVDDLAQEVKLRFFEKGMEAFEHRGNGSLTAFVRQDARYRRIDEMRRRARARVEGAEGLGSNDTDAGRPEPAWEVTGIPTRMARDDEHASIRAFVSEILPEEDKAAVRERFENNASWEAAAEAAEVSGTHDALRKRLQRAFDQARQHFEGSR